MSGTSYFRRLVVAALRAGAGLAHASFTVITSQADFLGSVAAPGQDSFDDLGAGVAGSPLVRLTGGPAYGYTVRSVFDGGSNLDDTFYNTRVGGDTWLTANSSTNSVQFSNFSGGVKAIGGYLFATDIDGLLVPGQTLQLKVTDANNLTTTQTLVAGSASAFIGLVSTVPLQSLSFTSPSQNPAINWPTVNDLILASPTAAVPELRSWALMLAGLGFVVLSTRRRRD